MDRIIERLVNEVHISEELAQEMVRTYLSKGGTHCCILWPDQFSWFNPDLNVLDILLEEKVLQEADLQRRFE